jgi:hypothetical protein
MDGFDKDFRRMEKRTRRVIRLAIGAQVAMGLLGLAFTAAGIGLAIWALGRFAFGIW